MKFFGTMAINNNNTLEIGGCDSVKLAEEFGTPLYVVDEALVRENCKTFSENFVLEDVKSEVIYASKSFLNIAMCKLIQEEGLSLDVVSGGELYTAIKANFPVDKIYMHGNNKTKDELIMALKFNVGRIIVDNQYEIDLLEDLCNQFNKSIDVLLRVNPGIDAHTHEYIKTAKHDSKFGESIFSENINTIIENFKCSKNLNLVGFHCHIGSQIFNEESYYSAISTMLTFIKNIKNTHNFVTKELNIGGGFGVYYSQEDTPMIMDKFLKNLLVSIKNLSESMNIITPKIMIEPGRSIIANAGSTLYTIGGIKHTYGGKSYIFVDGGMTDNPRPALYNSKYEAAISNKINCKPEKEYTIAGKCCESGDILVKNIELPKAERNDTLVIFSTGAYNYTMSSNYNRIPRPAVVLVKDGQSKLIVKRETYEDIIRNDIL